MTHEATSRPPGRQAPLLFLLICAFLFSMGLGLVFPVLPFIVMKLAPQAQQTAATIGWLGATYAALSFFAAPVLGALSDAYGRKPVLLIALLGSAIGSLLFGLAGSLWLLFAGRAVDGLCAGGMSAIFGYVADTTSEEERGKVFGQIGAVVGAGFIIGPALGGLASHLSLSAPLFLAAGLTALNLLFGLFVLPESLPESRRSRHFDAAHLNPLRQLSGALAFPVVRRLISVSVMFALAFSVMQVAISLLAHDLLNWGPGPISTLFMVVGGCDIVAQGLLLPRLLKWLGERGTALLGLGLGALGMLGMALLPTLPLAALLYGATVLFACGEGLFGTALGTLVSLSTPPEAQGQVQGGAQAFASLAQVAGPLGGGQLYSRFGAATTFGVGVAVVAGALALLALSQTRMAQPQAEVAG